VPAGDAHRWRRHGGWRAVGGATSRSRRDPEALAALLFLYTHVLLVSDARPGDFTLAKRPHRAHAVRTPVETAAVLDEMTRTSPPARLGGAAGTTSGRSWSCSAP
jgi:hypothetical protein